MKAIDYHKKQILLLFFTCFGMQVFGQWEMPQDYPGPNAANLGLYGQIPVSGFTGTPNISIPIYTIQLHDYKLPIELRYHLGSVKPDVQPSWTGLGWSLIAGGSITRIIRGLRDETTGDDFYRERGGNQLGSNFGYYYNSSILINASNWTDKFFLKYYGFSEASSYFNCYVDLEPDEFLFNFAGFSGSFFYNGKSGSKDLFKVKSQQPVNFDISMAVANTNININREYLTVFKKVAPQDLPLQSYISKFTIIDQNGIKYEFGGNKDAIDFTTTPGYLNTVTTAVTWYLTSITTPNGDNIRFTYKKDGDLFVNTRLRESLYTISSQSGCSTAKYNIGSTGDAHLSILHLSYLTKITTSAGETIDFASSPSSELGYAYNNTSPLRGITQTVHNKVILRDNGNYKLKLDTITISNTKEKLWTYNFKYNNDLTKRLHLDTLKTNQFKYEFKYNTTNFSSYNAKQNDNWGFFNGKSYDNVSYNNLYQYRTPDTVKMKAETLEEIIYPTGGSTKFEYEAHTYSKVSTLYSDLQNTFGLKNETGIAGGLRIRKIISRPDRTSTTGEVIKEYLYTNPNGTSSGILSGIPAYETIIKQDYATAYYQSENYINPLGNTNGAHVTYSRVVEKLSDGSSTVYYFTNHEDQRDEAAVYGISNVSYQSAFIAPFSSKEVGRGLIKAEVHKNSGGVTLDSTCYEYKYPYEPFIKSVSRNCFIFPCNVFETMFCSKQYACIPTLTTKTEVIYDMTGKNPATATTNYSFNSKNLLSTININRSNGEKQTTKYVYPSDVPGGPDKTVLQKMADKNIISDYVEKITYLNDSRVIDGEYRKFSEVKANTGIFKPERVSLLLKTPMSLTSTSLYPNHSLVKSFTIASSPVFTYKYSGTFNLDFSGKATITLSLYYGTNSPNDKRDFYLIIKDSKGVIVYYKRSNISNAAGGIKIDYKETVNLQPDNYTIDFTNDLTYNNGVNYFYGSCSMNIEGETGTTIADSPNLKPEVYYLYDKYGNIQEVKQAGSNISTTYLWSYSNQYPIAKIENATYNEVKSALSYTSDTQIESLSAQSNPDMNLIDSKLRAYFKDKTSLVTTYTYKPLVGMLTMTDPRGVVTKYEYDSFNRLAVTRNMDNNIVSHYWYVYQGGTKAPVIENPEPPNLPLQAFIILDYSNSFQVKASVQITGGSGDYTISWQLKNASGTNINLIYDGTSVSFKAPAIEVFTLQCTVTDNMKNISTTASTKVLTPLAPGDPIL